MAQQEGARAGRLPRKIAPPIVPAAQRVGDNETLYKIETAFPPKAPPGPRGKRRAWGRAVGQKGRARARFMARTEIAGLGRVGKWKGASF
jgi:hypothetical protein